MSQAEGAYGQTLALLSPPAPPTVFPSQYPAPPSCSKIVDVVFDASLWSRPLSSLGWSFPVAS